MKEADRWMHELIKKRENTSNLSHSPTQLTLRISRSFSYLWKEMDYTYTNVSNIVTDGTLDRWSSVWKDECCSAVSTVNMCNLVRGFFFFFLKRKNVTTPKHDNSNLAKCYNIRNFFECLIINSMIQKPA